MKVTIECTPKEMADLVSQLQGQPFSSSMDVDEFTRQLVDGLRNTMNRGAKGVSVSVDVSGMQRPAATAGLD